MTAEGAGVDADESDLRALIEDVDAAIEATRVRLTPRREALAATREGDLAEQDALLAQMDDYVLAQAETWGRALVLRQLADTMDGLREELGRTSLALEASGVALGAWELDAAEVELSGGVSGLEQARARLAALPTELVVSEGLRMAAILPDWRVEHALAATDVVPGRVGEIRYEHGEGVATITLATVAIEESLRGLSGTITMWTPGGVDREGRLRLVSPGPVFREGDRVIAFVVAEGPYYVVPGDGTGAYIPITDDGVAGLRLTPDTFFDRLREAL